jgi:hypothetical protein
MPPKRPADAELAARLRSQLLSGEPAADPVAVAERLLAIQGQDPRGARLAVRARTTGLHASDVDAALNEGALLIAWLNRGTLHLVRSEDFWWLHALTTPQLRTGSDRRLSQEGVTPRQLDKGIAEIRRAIAADGPRTREELRERLRAARVETAGQALIHVLFRAGIEGVVVRGPMRGKQHCYVLAEQWAGTAPAVDRTDALRELAVRYLAGHAPADDRDLAKWAGITLADARRALAETPAPRRSGDPGLPASRLLGAFDPVLLGWADRTPIVPPARIGEVVSGGIFRPFVLHGGRAAGTWRYERGRVAVDAWRRVPLRDEVADVERFLG